MPPKRSLLSSSNRVLRSHSSSVSSTSNRQTRSSPKKAARNKSSSSKRKSSLQYSPKTLDTASSTKRSRQTQPTYSPSSPNIATPRPSTSSLHNKAEAVSFLPLTRAGWSLAEGLDHLCRVEPKFIEVIDSHELPENFHEDEEDRRRMRMMSPSRSNEKRKTRKRLDSFTTLLKSIISQQLSIQVAATIYERFCAAIGVADKEDNIDPELVQRAQFKQILVEDKSTSKMKMAVNNEFVGLSGAKASYIQSLAAHFLDDSLLKGVDFDTLNDEEVFEKLRAVKGLGEWSVHMFMIFHLHRCNVLPVGDLAVRRGICMLYGLPVNAYQKMSNTTASSLKEKCAHWSPYSTLACMYMWKIASNKN